METKNTGITPGKKLNDLVKFGNNLIAYFIFEAVRGVQFPIVRPLFHKLGLWNRGLFKNEILHRLELFLIAVGSVQKLGCIARQGSRPFMDQYLCPRHHKPLIPGKEDERRGGGAAAKIDGIDRRTRQKNSVNERPHIIQIAPQALDIQPDGLSLFNGNALILHVPSQDHAVQGHHIFADFKIQIQFAFLFKRVIADLVGIGKHFFRDILHCHRRQIHFAHFSFLLFIEQVSQLGCFAADRFFQMDITEQAVAFELVDSGIQPVIFFKRFLIDLTSVALKDKH